MRAKATTQQGLRLGLGLLKMAIDGQSVVPSPAHQYALAESDQDELFVGFLGSFADFEVLFDYG